MNVEQALTAIANRPISLPYPPNSVLQGLQILSGLQPERNSDYDISLENERICFHGFDATIALMSEEQVARMVECGWTHDDGYWVVSVSA